MSLDSLGTFWHIYLSRGACTERRDSQPHSRLNMFQHANDRKSHLILNLLSWVDFLRPKYCVFENVRGFLRYNLHAYQAGKHRLEGGVEMGGLKFLIRALLAMRYDFLYTSIYR